MKIFNKVKCFVNKRINNVIRNIEENKRLKIGEDFQSTVNFLMRKNKKGENLYFLDQLKYIDRNPFVDSVKDIPTLFTKGREHKLIVRLVQTNYRIKKSGEVFTVDPGNNEDVLGRCKAYEFIYTYYRPISKKDNEIRLCYIGFNICMNYDKDSKTRVYYNE